MTEFDPYYKWLGIPPVEQPPTYYRLIGVQDFEQDADVIESAADRQMTHLRTLQGGPRGELSQRLLNEVSKARGVLLNLDVKRTYDQELRAKSDVTTNETQPVSPPTPPAPIPVTHSPVANQPNNARVAQPPAPIPVVQRAAPVPILQRAEPVRPVPVSTDPSGVTIRPIDDDKAGEKSSFDFFHGMSQFTIGTVAAAVIVLVIFATVLVTQLIPGKQKTQQPIASTADSAPSRSRRLRSDQDDWSGTPQTHSSLPGGHAISSDRQNWSEMPQGVCSRPDR